MASAPRSEGLDDSEFEAEPSLAEHGHDTPVEQKAFPSTAEETLEDVQSYLQELYSRYGLSQMKPGEHTAAAPPRPEPTTRTAAPSRPADESIRTPDPSAPRSLPDPKPPPERRRDILTLRELSTNSARGAIAHFDAGRLLAATWSRFWLCVAALGLALFFLRLVEPLSPRTLGAAAVALTLAVYWCGQFWVLTCRGGRIDEKPECKVGGARAS